MACPAQAIYMLEDTAVIDQKLCRHCGICYDSCPTEAISVHEDNNQKQEQEKP
ncbi:MAG: 4Fe-4S binding protein [Lentisphaerae bacterium]|nr:4Fe-4S binding protein [Lentisphaerota bacterium]